MSQSSPPAGDKSADKKEMTAAEAAKKVRRTVIEYVDGKDAEGKPVKIGKPRKVAVEANEVLSHADYGSHVVVVTKDGQKLSSAED